ncbi:acetyl-CoA C-acyltransferase [Indioceanicola profundi]|uniref:acetyl-CoA C-acyltransferase n=1 Tax=Indioceanicola profundi TaxID=2220096 RepID=UPI000E6AB9F2|nr:acetyl-CoA C-acyltransferase [Indioceanicola profundi]
MLNAYLYDGVRTPFGKHAGSLSSIRPDDLLGATIRALIDRNPAATEHLEDVVVGCANQAGEDSRCVARHASLVAGLPVEIGGTVIQRNCGSGLGAIATAAQAITAGEGDLMLSGGVESMSRAAFVMSKADAAFSRNIQIFDSSVGARFPNKQIEKQFGSDTMPQTADNLAREYQITREESDRFALRSQENYARAAASGFFDGEIAPVHVPQRRGDPIRVDKDENPRPTTMEALAKLKPLHEGGVTTAGSSSGINDGAVALIVGGREAGERLGKAPKVRILSSAVAGVEPRIMGFGPVPASKKALDRAGLTVKDMDVIEINEAFAAQVLACLRGLDIDFDDSRINPNGGSIALGHPLGASGPRLFLTAARQLEQSGGRYGLVSMCIGVGQGIAVVIERV